MTTAKLISPKLHLKAVPGRPVRLPNTHELGGFPLGLALPPLLVGISGR
jgi:hypothetical protein